MTEHLTDRVVVFGVDGVRHDTLLAARTPAVDAIAAAGFLAPFRVNDAGPTISGPGWTTIATGVLATKHRVFNNDLTEHQISKFPDFLSRAREVGFSTYAAGSWPQLVTETHGGPIFLGGGSMPCGDDPETAEAFDRADQLVADEAAGVLGERDIAAAFVYFGLPDVVAHAEGPTADYAASVEACDRRIGQVMAAIRGGSRTRKSAGPSWSSPTTGTRTRAGTAGRASRSGPRGSRPPGATCRRARPRGWSRPTCTRTCCTRWASPPGPRGN